MLIPSLKNKYGDKYRKLILTCDGAKYHLVKEINNYLIQEEMMMLQIIPYTPEFAAIEIFINLIKSKNRKKLALTKEARYSKVKFRPFGFKIITDSVTKLKKSHYEGFMAYSKKNMRNNQNLRKKIHTKIQN